MQAPLGTGGNQAIHYTTLNRGRESGGEHSTRPSRRERQGEPSGLYAGGRLTASFPLACSYAAGEITKSEYQTFTVCQPPGFFDPLAKVLPKPLDGPVLLPVQLPLQLLVFDPQLGDRTTKRSIPHHE